MPRDYFTSVGCYPIAHYDGRTGDVLCAGCADDDCEPDERGPWEEFINWEDASLYCEECGNRIESAYAEDDAHPGPVCNATTHANIT